MNDPIEREDAIKAVEEVFDMGDCYCDRYGVRGAINAIPSADRPQVGYTGVDEDYLVSVQEVLNITAETGALETQRRVRELARRDRPQEESILQDTIQRLERVIKHGAIYNGLHSVSAEAVLNWLKGADDEKDIPNTR